MKQRFHVGKGRYESMNNSRFKDYTYGKDKFADSEAEPGKHGTYGALLFDKRWITKRSEIILRDQGCCVICKSSKGLQVHHRQYHFIKALDQYKAPWDYENHLMITLCEKCHTRGHSKFRVPKIHL